MRLPCQSQGSASQPFHWGKNLFVTLFWPELNFGLSCRNFLILFRLTKTRVQSSMHWSTVRIAGDRVMSTLALTSKHDDQFKSLWTIKSKNPWYVTNVLHERGMEHFQAQWSNLGVHPSAIKEANIYFLIRNDSIRIQETIFLWFVLRFFCIRICSKGNGYTADMMEKNSPENFLFTRNIEK